MYLAEDKIMCIEILTNKNYIIKCLPDSKCVTDPVINFLGVMK